MSSPVSRQFQRSGSASASSLITSTGIGSGLDISAIVSSLTTPTGRRRPIS